MIWRIQHPATGSNPSRLRFLLCLALVVTGCGNHSRGTSERPKNWPDEGIPLVAPLHVDARAVTDLVEAVAISIYEPEEIRRQRPFTAKLENGVWYVWGSDHRITAKGGVLQVRLNATNLAILSITHGK